MTTEVGATLEETAALDETGEASCPEAQQCADVDCAPGAAPSHGTDIQPIWDALCTQCHFAAEPAPPGDLDLTTGVSFFSLVNVASQQSGSGLLRVSPGNPNESYLWHKIMNTHTCTTPAGDTDGMPTTDAPLSETNPDELATITEWICCGTPL